MRLLFLGMISSVSRHPAKLTITSNTPLKHHVSLDYQDVTPLSATQSPTVLPMDDGALAAKNSLARRVVAGNSGNMISSLDEQTRQRNKDMKARFNASHTTLIAFLLIFAYVTSLRPCWTHLLTCISQRLAHHWHLPLHKWLPPYSPSTR